MFGRSSHNYTKGAPPPLLCFCIVDDAFVTPLWRVIVTDESTNTFQGVKFLFPFFPIDLPCYASHECRNTLNIFYVTETKHFWPSSVKELMKLRFISNLNSFQCLLTKWQIWFHSRMQISLYGLEFSNSVFQRRFLMSSF